MQQKTAQKTKARFNWKRFTFAVLSCVIVIFLVLRTHTGRSAESLSDFNSNLQNYNVKLQVVEKNSSESLVVSRKSITEFFVAVADDDKKREYGLMNLKHLPEDHGMLFIMPQNQVIVMWMKDTKIPLDMIFIDENNLIANVKTDAKPMSLDLISSEKKVKMVLEINAGLVKKLGIKIGQKIKIKN